MGTAPDFTEDITNYIVNTVSGCFVTEVREAESDETTMKKDMWGKIVQ